MSKAIPWAKPGEQILKVGDKIAKRSGKPFKSGRKVNTIKEFVVHPQTGQPGITFEEDDSIMVEAGCRPATEAELALNYRHWVRNA